MNQNKSTTAVCLAGIILSLTVVGFVSSTVLRHAVQIIPVLTALIFVIWRADLGRFAAVPIFLWWFLLMLLIWLFLLGIARMLTGHFTPTEIVCTVVIGICCVIGTAASIRNSRPANLFVSVLIVLSFAGFQLAALWLSFRPPISNH